MTTNQRTSRCATAGLCAALATLLFAVPAAAVPLDGSNTCTVKLRDGTDVILIGEFVSKFAKRSVDEEAEAPGLPSPLPAVATRADGRPGAVTTRSGGGSTTPDLLNAGGDERGATVGSARNSAFERFEETRAQDGGRPESLFGKHTFSNRYYYLPPGNSLRLSMRPDGRTPEFLFVKYTSDEKDGPQGGLMHFLMEWSLTKAQERDLQAKAKQKCKRGDGQVTVVGPAELGEDGEQSFRIISGVLSDEGMKRSMVQSGHAPTVPGGKVAAAANLTADGAQLFLATVEQSRSIADLSVELDFTYTTMLPAAKGRIIFHWNKLQEMIDTFESERVSDNQESGFWWWHEEDYAYSEAEAQAMFNSMVEEQVVEFDFEGYDPDSEYTGKILEAMLQYFLNSMMEPTGDSFIEMPGSDGEGGVSTETVEIDTDHGRGTKRWSIAREAWQKAFATKKQEILLDAGLAVRRKHQVVGNMASWYNSVRDNRKCVQEVNLNDPFFAHREIRFILDLDAKEIFESMVNYVTINVKKPRAKGNDFNESLTIDADHLANQGIVASTTYARGEDRNSELYMYQTQWSLKGGNLYPANPNWRRGKWEGVTLAPPIERWNVEVEGDLEQMEQSGIARVTVELHYPLFGQEEFTVMPLSPRAGEWLKSDAIYVDRGTRGFAYRLIIHHKEEGRLALPWRTRIGDRYVYATIPEEILVAGSPAREKAKAAAKKLGQLGAEKVLDEFQELFAEAD